jgi:ABC-type histidine transport system ATPase subunit
LERDCEKHSGDALLLVHDALEARTSKACYLLGSFSSGKSRLMALLNLLL